jgi:hypothetical protein
MADQETDKELPPIDAENEALNTYILMLEEFVFAVLQRCNNGDEAPYDRIREIKFDEIKRKHQIIQKEIFTSKPLRRLCTILEAAREDLRLDEMASVVNNMTTSRARFVAKKASEMNADLVKEEMVLAENDSESDKSAQSARKIHVVSSEAASGNAGTCRTSRKTQSHYVQNVPSSVRSMIPSLEPKIEKAAEQESAGNDEKVVMKSKIPVRKVTKQNQAKPAKQSQGETAKPKRWVNSRC